MKSFVLSAAFVFAATTAATVSAQVTVSDPWIRGTVPQQTATGAFMLLTAQESSRLIGASSPAARSVEIHEMKMEENHVMRMRQIPELALPAGKVVELKPGGYHIMMMGLKQQMKEGDTVPITLEVETAGKQRKAVEVQVPVRSLTAPAHGGR